MSKVIIDMSEFIHLKEESVYNYNFYKHVEERLEHHCTQINSYSYSVNNERTIQAMTETLHRMWREMLALGLFSNFEEFPDDPVIVSSHGEVSSYVFIFRECPFWYDGGKEWEVRV